MAGSRAPPVKYDSVCRSSAETMAAPDERKREHDGKRLHTEGKTKIPLLPCAFGAAALGMRLTQPHRCVRRTNALIIVNMIVQVLTIYHYYQLGRRQLNLLRVPRGENKIWMSFLLFNFSLPPKLDSLSPLGTVGHYRYFVWLSFIWHVVAETMCWCIAT